MAWPANAPAVARRLARACPAIGPRARARLLAGFLAANLAMVLLSMLYRLGWGWMVPGDWLVHLDGNFERGFADRYAAVVFGTVAVLAAAQALRPPPTRSGPRWLWTVGWLSAASVIALVAVWELHQWTDVVVFLAPAFGMEELAPRFRWVLVAAPLAAPLAVAAGWVLVTAQRGHPARALLAVLAVTLALSALIHEVLHDTLLYHLGTIWLGFPKDGSGLKLEIEEGSELMAAAALGVILIEMLAARPRPARGELDLRTGGGRRRWVGFTVGAVLLAAATFPLLTTRHVHEGDGLETVAPWSYTGPVSLVEQQFRATHDNLRRIDVWAYVDGVPGAAAEIFARLTLAGSDQPLRESRAEVRGAPFSNATAAFHFEPIPDSRGTLYTLAVGVLSGPTPYVFLGLTGGDVIPEGTAVVSGAPTRYADDIAMRAFGDVRGIEWLIPRDSRNWVRIGETTLHIFLWVLLAVATWTGLSGPRPRFWRRFVWRSVLTSALITAGILVIALAFFAVLSPTRLA